jgi:hypothetical protein
MALSPGDPAFLTARRAACVNGAVSDEPEASPPSRRPVLIVLGMLALYVFAYFPTMSYIVRHPQYQRGAAAWRPIPGVIRQAMFRVWSKLDPTGFQIVDSQLAAHPAR